MNISILISKAIEMTNFSYVPYSHFHVGAALLTTDGTIYGGCNIENSSYGATNCAERTAFFKAISEGHSDFEAIAIVGGFEDLETGKINIKDLCPPCGICRQIMNEFCNKDFKIILATDTTNYKIVTLEDLLPLSFKLNN